MRYDLDIKPRAIKDMKGLPEDMRPRVLEKIRVMCEDLTGDVSRLTRFTPEYRLRVGDYRVLFEVEESRIVVYRVVHRREAYR